MLLAALAQLEAHLDGLDALLVNTVHDEIVLEVGETDAEHAAAALETAMVEGMQMLFPNATTKGLVEVHSGPTWADAK